MSSAPRSTLALVCIMPLAFPIEAQVRPTYKLEFPIAAFQAIDPATNKPVPTLSSAPSGSLFQVVADQDVNNAKGVIVKFTRVGSLDQPAQAEAASRLARIMGIAGPANFRRLAAVSEGTPYWIERDLLPDNFYALESGVDAGTLAVPFKLQLNDGRLSAGGTLGLYVGYRQKSLRAPSTVLLSAGLAALPTARPPLAGAPATDVDTKIGVTIATGLIFEIVGQIQAGVILGIDHTGEGRDVYRYENRPWISFAIGAGFLKR